MVDDGFEDWPDYKRAIYEDEISALQRLGARVFMDDNGDVEYIRLSGHKYCDTIVSDLARLDRLRIRVLDLRDTEISPSGVAWLQDKLPTTIIDC